MVVVVWVHHLRGAWQHLPRGRASMALATCDSRQTGECPSTDENEVIKNNSSVLPFDCVPHAEAKQWPGASSLLCHHHHVEALAANGEHHRLHIEALQACCCPCQKKGLGGSNFDLDGQCFNVMPYKGSIIKLCWDKISKSSSSLRSLSLEVHFKTKHRLQ